MSSRWIRGLAARLLPHKPVKSRRPQRGLRLESLESRYAMNADTVAVPDLSSSAVILEYDATQDASALGGAAFSPGDSAYAAYGGDAYGGAPYGGDSYGGDPYGGDPYGGQPYNQAPSIVDATLVYTEGDWMLQGRVIDDQLVAGQSVFFTGAYEGDCMIAADGTFSKLVEGNEVTLDSICATYTDSAGLSAEETYFLT
jgi:hypothetical protein